MRQQPLEQHAIVAERVPLREEFPLDQVSFAESLPELRVSGVRDGDAAQVHGAVLEHAVGVPEVLRAVAPEAQHTRGLVLEVVGLVPETKRSVPAARAALVRLDVEVVDEPRRGRERPAGDGECERDASAHDHRPES